MSSFAAGIVIIREKRNQHYLVENKYDPVYESFRPHMARIAQSCLLN